MAAFSDNIKIYIDVVADNAKAGFSKIKSDISQTEGLINKFKVGASGAMTQFGALAAGGLATAGAAAVAYGVKSVMAFTDTAKAALDLSTATGLSVEEASRWIAVGDDFEVTAEALATGLGKVAKTLDDEKWSKYGIATRDASGQARDVNDILLDTFDMLSQVTNETERARIGQELFGKGYQSLTPILGHTRAEYEKMLATQKEGQVITAEEAKRAEATRLALDELHDTIGELALNLGGKLAPTMTEVATQGAKAISTLEKLKIIDALTIALKMFLAPTQSLITVLGHLADYAEALKEKLEPVGEEIADVADGFADFVDAIDLGVMDKLGDVLGKIGDGVGKVAHWMGLGGDENEEYAETFDLVANNADAAKGALALAKAEQNNHTGAVEAARKEQSDYVAGLIKMGEETKRATEAAKKQQDQLKATRDELRRTADGLYGVHDAERAFANSVDDANDTLNDSEATLYDQRAAIEDVAKSADDLAQQQVTLKGQTLDTDAGMQTWIQSMLQSASTLSGPLRDEVLAHISRVAGVPTSKLTTFDAAINAQSLAQVEAALNWAARYRNVTFNARGDAPGYRGAHATGTSSAPAGMALVGEEGPELIEMQGGERVHSNASTRNMLGNGGGNFYIYMPAGTNADDVAQKLRQFQKRNGYAVGDL